jgi:hypothetical protein
MRVLLFLPLLLLSCKETCTTCADTNNTIEICPTRNGLGVATAIAHNGNVYVWDVQVANYTKFLGQNGYKCQ